MPGEVVMASMSAAAAEDDDEEQGSCFIWSSLLHAPPESVLFGRARYTSESGTWYLRLKTGLKKQKTKKQMLRQSNHEHDKGERQSVEQATVDAEKNDKGEGGRPEAAVQPRLSPVVEQFAKLGHRRPEGDNDDAREGTLQKKCCLKRFQVRGEVENENDHQGGGDERGELRLPAHPVLNCRSTERPGAGIAEEEGADDVGRAQGEQLLVGPDLIAVPLGEHLLQREGRHVDDEAEEEGAGEELRQQVEARQDLWYDGHLVLGVEAEQVGERRQADDAENVHGEGKVAQPEAPHQLRLQEALAGHQHRHRARRYSNGHEVGGGQAAQQAHKGNGRLSVTVGRPGRRVNAQQAEDLTGEDVKGGGHHEGGDDRIGEQNGENAQSEGANGELMIAFKLQKTTQQTLLRVR
ncbi:hypothetical protein TYRP_003711 [Tyrophagus putrescentiae]|nr:hypothetical protein TYRP_003711 [Tyrophagus putrescentiae]